MNARQASSCACARVAGGSRGQAPEGHIANSGHTRRRPVSRPCIGPMSHRRRSCDLQDRHPCSRSSTTESYMLPAPASPEVWPTPSRQRSTARESVSASVSPGRQPTISILDFAPDGAKRSRPAPQSNWRWVIRRQHSWPRRNERAHVGGGSCVTSNECQGQVASCAERGGVTLKSSTLAHCVTDAASPISGFLYDSAREPKAS
jgi:hypothetical protein